MQSPRGTPGSPRRPTFRTRPVALAFAEPAERSARPLVAPRWVSLPPGGARLRRRLVVSIPALLAGLQFAREARSRRRPMAGPRRLTHFRHKGHLAAGSGGR